MRLTLSSKFKQMPRSLGRSPFGNPFIHRSESPQKRKDKSQTNQRREKETQEDEQLCELKMEDGMRKEEEGVDHPELEKKESGV